MQTTYQEPIRPWSFVLSQANGSLSRAAIVVGSGSGILQPGTVMAQLTATGKCVPYNPAGSGGAQAAFAILAERIDATSADVTAAAIVKLAEVAQAELQWGPGVTTQVHKDAAAKQLFDTRNIAVR